MSKFLITASVVSAFVIGFVAPASALEIQNTDNSEYAINLYVDKPDTVDVKTFKLMPGQNMKGLCADQCTVQIDDGRNNFDSFVVVLSDSKVRIKNGRIVSN